MKQYDVFISYSHRADAGVAKQLESGLKNMGRRWNERRALEVFRDEASLSASPHLWETLAAQLDAVDYAVVLLSPEAVESPWVGREIDHFLNVHDEDRLLIGLTAGELVWDSTSNDWSSASTAVPEQLRGRLKGEPCWVDLRWARGAEDLRWRDTAFRAAVATLAAPVHGLSKDELEGEDVRAHRKFVRVRRVAVASLVLFLTLALAASTVAVASQRQTATERSLRRQVQRTNDELTTANTELDLLNAELDRRNLELDRTNVQLEESNEALAETNGLLDVRNQELDDANAALRVTNDQLDTANDELEITNDELEIANDQLDASNLHLAAANSELALTNEKLDASNAQLVDLEARAASSAGLSVCSQAQTQASTFELEGTIARYDEFVQEHFLPKLDELRKLIEQPHSLEELRQLVESFEAPGFLGTPLTLLARYFDPKPCSQVEGFPFREFWSTIGDPTVGSGTVYRLPNCADVIKATTDQVSPDQCPE